MSDILIWLSNHPVILAILLGVTLLLIVIFIVMAIVAMIQGRSITLWPPGIGEKPLIQKEVELISPPENDTKAITPEELIITVTDESTIDCKWTSPNPLAKQILQDTENVVLFIGTSLHRILYSDFFEYREWLQHDTSRYIGLIFLNHYSPHALGRERKDVQRSRQSNIIGSVQLALTESSLNSHVLIAIHDGPFRYSARAMDIGFQSPTKGSRIQIISSSHTRGISEGFEIILRPSNGRPYQYYKNELMDVWKQSKANTSGHGISVIAKSNSLIEWKAIEEFSSILIQSLGDKKLESYQFGLEQHHLTLSSLCRTQLDVLGKPLSIGESNDENSLPNHFGEFLATVYEKAVIFRKNPTTVIFDKIVLDKHGYYSLTVSLNGNLPELPILISDFQKDVQNLVDAFSTKYPNENWKFFGNQRNEYRFGPKPNGIGPHITLGMVFKHNGFFPLPLKGVETFVILPKPINYRLDNIIIGHYAYRSYLRTVGELHIDSSKPLYSPLEMLFKLGISNFGQSQR